MTSVRPRPDFAIEQRLRARGYARVAGTDEVGRGPLAGPVVAAAVVFPDADAPKSIPGLTDSKLLTPTARESLYKTICAAVDSWEVARVEADEIDRINILQASLKAMALAVSHLDPQPDYLLVDGQHSPARYLSDPSAIGVDCLIKGDSRSASVAAASVLAKVARDRLMREYAIEYPQYGFDRHKGYPTEQHRDAIAQFGACPIHRRSFRGVREHV